MTEKADTRCQIEVEAKDSGLTRILIVATNEKSTLKLFKKVRKEVQKNGT